MAIAHKEITMTTTHNPILESAPLGPRWPCLDPFLFCAHHDDSYPASDGKSRPRSTTVLVTRDDGGVIGA